AQTLGDAGDRRAVDPHLQDRVDDPPARDARGSTDRSAATAPLVVVSLLLRFPYPCRHSYSIVGAVSHGGWLLPESSVTSLSPDERSSAKEARAGQHAAHRAVLARIRPHLAVANFLVLLSAVCSVVPFLLIVEAARVLLDGRDEVWSLLGWALAVFAARALLYSGALFWTHLVDADNQLHLRRLVADKLRSVPLGWFGD